MDVFAYGALRSHRLMDVVAGGNLRSNSADISGYCTATLKGNVVPMIAPQAGGVVPGILWRDLTDEQLVRIDLYEGALGFEHADVDVICDGQIVTARCYMPPSDARARDVMWSYDTWEDNHLVPAVYAATELFSHVPMMDRAGVRGIWPMMESRAWSKYRATVAPATLRNNPAPGAIEILKTRPPAGQFFRLQSVDIRHQQFNGTRSDILPRESFLGVDAAVLLPYDPKLDRVLLVEQVRMGPVFRRDPNPWMLEPVAGIVDARETPQDAAHREAFEEAHITLRHLELAAQYYASPGSSTDYFFNYVGLCDLPMTDTYMGGLDAEGEDLRLHTLSFGDAMTLTETGEIATGPLVLLLYWLARHRDRLRAMS